MKILVINCGSSSIKYQVFDIDGKCDMLAKGLVERIGLSGSKITHTTSGKEKVVFEKDLQNHKEAMEAIEPILTDPECGIINDINEIQGVGHRVLHGGETFKSSAVITDEVLGFIRDNAHFGPLHMPANITGIEVCQQLLPNVKNVAVFDTAVHQSMPKKAYLYGLPIKYYKEKGIRRYGFHGTSHAYVSQEAADVIGKPFDQCKIITCHLGNGSSITAFENGKVADTSMGLTPLEGLIMGTRCGDIDTAAVLTIMDQENIGPKEMDNMLNKESGLKGISGHEDMRDVLDLAEKGDEYAQAAVDILVYKIQKYIGSYLAAINGADAIVFTAGIGENNAFMRDHVMANFGFLGVEIDKKKNDAGETVISTDDSKIKVLLIPTNEELMIAKDAYKLISASK